MNWLDGAFLAVAAVSVVIGLVRGFVRELLSVVTWVAAAWIAVRYGAVVAEWLAPWVASPTARLVAAFAGLFVGTLLVGALVGFLAVRLVTGTGLTGTDRALGMLFGAARGGLIIVAVVVAAAFTAVPRESWWRSSAVATWVGPQLCGAGIEEPLVALRGYLPHGFGDDGSGRIDNHWDEFCGRFDETGGAAAAERDPRETLSD
ncbi:CvpA family protein [Arhodomonas sp. SL1]|uniref:CvpA family protein n=1 Tax=Arhodomonas sp. SL1 TaxID=3425691 RepID=UPI003F882F3F